jgi:hypothetical protein
MTETPIASAVLHEPHMARVCETRGTTEASPRTDARVAFRREGDNHFLFLRPEALAAVEPCSRGTSGPNFVATVGRINPNSYVSMLITNGTRARTSRSEATPNVCIEAARDGYFEAAQFHNWIGGCIPSGSLGR